MADPNDDTLVLRTRQGDAAAFEALIRQHQRMIYSLAYRMTGSATDAEDLTQETFLRAYRQIGSFRAASKFSTWLYRIAINACLTLAGAGNPARGSPGRLGRDQRRAGIGRGNDAGPERNGPLRPCRPAQTAGQTARGHHADRLRRPQPRRGGGSFGLFGDDGFLAGVRRAEKTAALARRRRGRRSKMNHLDLESKIKSIRVPERDGEFWQTLPQRVLAQAQAEPPGSPARSPAPHFHYSLFAILNSKFVLAVPVARLLPLAKPDAASHFV